MDIVENDTIIVSLEEAHLRLDVLLAARFKHHSRSYFQSLIEENLVLLNGMPVKKRVKPNCGDEIEVQFALTQEMDVVPQPIPLNILYEDDSMIVIDKPPGLVVHPGAGNWDNTFANALLYHCKTLEVDDSSKMRPGIVHRLDKDTSGVLIAAKTLKMQQALVELFSLRKVGKEYLAICCGVPREGRIDDPIARHPTHRKLMAVVPDGKPAISYCKVLSRTDQFSFVTIHLETGRTHQIRVHMQHLGCPVLGDSAYGRDPINKR